MGGRLQLKLSLRNIGVSGPDPTSACTRLTRKHVNHVGSAQWQPGAVRYRTGSKGRDPLMQLLQLYECR